ncbi:uncharacterized protein [Rutidosis leptorrhynchoides]|uniref:uncharacterized protein n=1 Tax=Rutidosis leptorrhynchoides TaxID=125765 RepID=UPI003A995144
MVMADVDLELRQQLKEAGNLLSNPPAHVDELLHLLDQTERLLGMVDQSPTKLMQEALQSPIKALVDDRLLKHSNMDVKVSVANCICEITRVTAPDAPYSDEEMKGIFQLVVSTFQDLWDDSSRSYNKRLSILDIVYKVRSCVIMLDLECDALIITMFEHFLKSVRDHHSDKGFSIMKNIMSLVIEESEDISNDMLNLLLASIKTDSEGILPVTRKLGEEVIEKSANKLRPYLEKAVDVLNDSLHNYSQVLTSVCKGPTNVDKHKDECALVLHKTDETKLATASDDAVQVMSNAEGVNEKDEGSDGKDLKECETSNLQGNNSEKPTDSADAKNVESDGVAHPSNNSAEPTGSENDVESVAVAHPSKNGSPLKETEVINAGAVSTVVGFIKKGIRSKKSSGQMAAPSMDVVLTKAPEEMSDTEMKPPKRARKKIQKAEEAEKVLSKKMKADDSESKQRKKPGKKVDAVDLGSKKVDAVDLGSKKVGGKKIDGGEAGAKKSEQGDMNIDAGDSEAEAKKVDGVDSESKKVGGKKADGGEARAKKLKQRDMYMDAEDSESGAKKVDTVDPGSKKVGGKKTDGGEAGAKQSKHGDMDVDAGDSEVQPTKQSDTKKVASDSEDKQLKQSGKKGEKSKVLVKPVEDNTSNEETDSEATLVEVSENIDDESDSDDMPVKLSAKKGSKNSSVVKSSSKKKGGVSVEEKTQAKYVSDDDGMDVPLMVALKTAAKEKGKLEATGASSLKRKRSIAKPKDSETVKYDGSLIGQKVKVWWPDDKMYYEGFVASFDATEEKHKVSYLDGEEEMLNLKDEKWEIIQEYSVQYEQNAVEVEAQSTDDVPESPVKKKAKNTSGQSAQRSVKKNVNKPSDRRFVLGLAAKSVSGKKYIRKRSVNRSVLGLAAKSGAGNKGKSKGGKKSKAVVNSNENEKTKEKDEEKSQAVPKTSQEPHVIVYKSKGRKNKSRAAAAAEVEPEPNDDANVSSELKSELKELKDKDAAVEEQVNVVEKSTGTPKIGLKSGQKRKKT